MKQTPLLRSMVFICCTAGTLFFASCKKEGISTPQPVLNTSATAMNSGDISKALSPYGVLGKYYNRGSRTLYKGRQVVKMRFCRWTILMKKS